MNAPVVGRFGRVPPPPPGKMWVRNPAVAWGHSIVQAVERYKQAGEPVPEHLASLAEKLPADLPDSSVELVDDDFGVPPPPFASAEPITAAGTEPEPEPQPSLWDQDETEQPDLEGWTVAELKDALEQVGVEYPASARKHELIALLEEAEQ
jgi:hypothetical protein